MDGLHFWLAWGLPSYCDFALSIHPMAGGTVGQSIGMGAMRLSTAAGRNESAAIAVLHAAFDAGVTCLDTADAYCLDEHEAGHNERLIAQALSSWPGDRTRIRVATKGGMIRPQGAWVIDGRARHLITACQNSCRALGVDRIWLYQLHAPDPRVPLVSSATVSSNGSACATSPSARSRRRNRSFASTPCRSS